MPVANQLQNLQLKLRQLHLYGAIISKRENIHYLTGLHQIHPTNREALLFITPTAALLYHTLFLTPPQAKSLTTLPMTPTNPLPKILDELFPQTVETSNRPKPILAIESHDLKVAELEKFQSLLPHTQFKGYTNFIENLRLTKQPNEIESLRHAAAITAKTMSWAINLINQLTDQPITEVALARYIDNHLYDLGATGLAFPTVVAFGPHSASPHHMPTTSKLTPNTVVLFDFGCSVLGYSSDMTRTIWFGSKPNPTFKQIEAIVKKAYTAAIKMVSSHYSVELLTQSNDDPGSSSGVTIRDRHPNAELTASAIDLAARSVIENAGFGDQFIHTTGHGLGLEIHESPSLSKNNPQVLKPGMVITLEPGIYLEGTFGYRHENTLYLS